MKPKSWKEKRQHMVKSHISLDAVYAYVKHSEYPPGTNDLDKRSIRKRAKSFEIQDNHLVYIPEKSQKTLDDGTEINIESRRVLLKDEKRRQAIWEAHVDEQGTHMGMEKTTAAVSKLYYWMGISSLVREIIRDCAVCRASKAACGTAITLPILTSEIKSEVEDGTNDAEFEPYVPFHSMRIETATCFWQKVELQILGPFSQGKSMMYIVICLDRYSLWTEGAVIPAISSATVTHVILNLICRFGNMQGLLLRENENANRKNVEVREDLFAKAGLDVKLTVDNSAETADMWKNIEDQVERFTRKHPRCWSQCLDLCLLPLRISRPDMMEYTPDFLVYNREMSLPENLSHRPENFDIELHLNLEQMTKSTDALMNIYNGFCLSFPYYIPKLALARHTPDNTGAASKTNLTVIPGNPATTTSFTATSNVQQTTIKPVTVATPSLVTASTSVTSSASVTAATTVTPATEVTSVTTVTPATTLTPATTGTAASSSTSMTFSSPSKSKSVRSDECEKGSKTERSSKSVTTAPVTPRKKVITRSGRISVPTPGMVSLLSGKDSQRDDEKYGPPSKKARVGRPVKEKKSDGKKSVMDVNEISSSKEDQQEKTCTETVSFDSPDKMEDLDVYYTALKQYIVSATYMPGSSVHQKRVIRKISKNYVIEDDVMYYVQESKGKVTKKVVVMTMSERIDLLRAAHVLEDGSHVCKQRVVDSLEQQNKYWKGLTLDAYAFTRACRTCEHGRERLRDYSHVKDDDEDDEEDDEDDFTEEDVQEDSYDDLINYLKYRRYPKGTSPNQKSTIRKRSKNFTFIEDELYYVFGKSSDMPSRKVLLTESERTAAIKQAHSANHWGINKTMVNVREMGYWSGMTNDCHNYLKKCKKCTKRLLTSSSSQDEMKKKKKRIEQRVKRFQELFVAKIMELDKKAEDVSCVPVVTVKVERDSGDHDLNEQDLSASQTQASQTQDNQFRSECESSPIQQHILSGEQKSCETSAASSGQTTLSYNLVSDNIEHTYSVGQKSGSDILTVSVVPSNSVDETTPPDNQLMSTDPVKADHLQQMRVGQTEQNSTETDVKDFAVGRTEQNATETDVKQFAVGRTEQNSAETDVKQFAVSQTEQNSADVKSFAVGQTEQNSAETDVKEFAVIQNINILPAGEGQTLKMEDRIITVEYDNFVQTDDNGNGDDEGASTNEVSVFFDQTRAEQLRSTESGQLQEVIDVKASKKQKFKCEYCGKIIKGAVSYKYHVFKHTGVKPFECEICSKKFTNNKSCRLHMRKHTGELPFLCNLCGKKFSRAASLQYHLKAHSAGGGVPVECEVCKRTFTTAVRLRKHMNCKHPERPPVYECHQCNKVFTASRSLKRHQASHQGIRHYQCQFCGRGFFRKEYLNSHMLQHPEAGSVTPKTKSQRKKPQLTLSFETQDLNPGTPGQEYQCQYCGQVFLHKDYLSSHMLQHPESGSIVVITSDSNGQTKKREMALSYDGQSFDNETEVGHRDMQELQRQQVEDAAQEQAIQSIVQIEAAAPQESTSYVLSQDAVEYEVECFTSESLTEADLKAIQILTQASLHGPL